MERAVTAANHVTQRPIGCLLGNSTILWLVSSDVPQFREDFWFNLCTCGKLFSNLTRFTCGTNSNYYTAIYTRCETENHFGYAATVRLSLINNNMIYLMIENARF